MTGEALGGRALGIATESEDDVTGDLIENDHK